MATIRVPKPPKSAFNKERPVSGLLRSHLEHLQRAEFRLPAGLQTNIYINAIKSEGAAAEYIKLVTERLHEAHGIAPKKKGRAKGGIAIAAAAAKPKKKRKSASKARTKAKAGSKRRK